MSLVDCKIKVQEGRSFWKCRECNETLPLTLFRKKAKSRTGYERICLQCHSDQERDRTARRTPSEKAETYRFYKLRCMPTILFLSARNRARAREQPFDVTKLYIAAVLRRSLYRCALCSCAVIFAEKKVEQNSLTLDTVDPERGYVVGNIEVLCFQCNTSKGARSPASMLEFAAQVIAHYEGRRTPQSRRLKKSWRTL